MRRVAS